MNRANSKARRGVLLFLLSALVIFGAMYVLYSALNTLRLLDAVEADRDRWQRPADILQALDLHPGSVAADIGSGAGYFTLKLSPAVGSRGEVFAVDLRKLSLTFLWIRAARRSPHNIHIIIGRENDPRLSEGTVDSVLIANTYHEFRNPPLMLDAVRRALRPGSRLVIVDRGPPAASTGSTPETDPHHEIPLEAVEKDLRANGFDILRRDEKFISLPGEETWWLLVARKNT